MKIRILYLDGTEQDVVAGAAAKVALEHRTNTIWFDALKDEAIRRTEHMYFLSWRAIPESDRPEFKDWLERVEEVEILDEETRPDPTQTDPGPAD